MAIGYWYEDFQQDSEEEVAELIERSRGAKVGETNDTDTYRGNEARSWKEKARTGARSGQ